MFFIIIFLIFFLPQMLYSYYFTLPASSYSSGEIILKDNDSAIFFNNSFNGFNNKNKIIFTGVYFDNAIFTEGESLNKFSGIISYSSLKYFNIDLAYNFFNYTYYNESYVLAGISKNIKNNFSISLTFKYFSTQFLNFDINDPILNNGETKSSEYNFDYSVCYRIKKEILSGISFENLLSVNDFFTKSSVNDMPFIIRVNIMTPFYLKRIKGDIGTQVEFKKNNMRYHIGFSIPVFKYFKYSAGYISNSSINTGFSLLYNFNNINTEIDYALKYLYNIETISHIISLKIKF